MKHSSGDKQNFSLSGHFAPDAAGFTYIGPQLNAYFDAKSMPKYFKTPLRVKPESTRIFFSLPIETTSSSENLHAKS